MKVKQRAKLRKYLLCFEIIGFLLSTFTITVTPVKAQVVLLSENFEDGLFDSRISVATVGGFSSMPGIQPIPNFGSTMAFGFGRSSCGASCFDRYVTDLNITFPSPINVSTLSFKEMERYSNWGSTGHVLLDGAPLTPDDFFGRVPGNDWHADTTYRVHTFPIDRSITVITLKVTDITNASEIFIDDLEIRASGEPSNVSPTLDAIDDLTINEDEGVQTRNLIGISAGSGDSQALAVTAVSSNTGLIPHPNVTYTSPNTTGSLSFTPIADANGTATITVTVDDGQPTNNTVTRSFLVTVNQVNDPPDAVNDTGKTFVGTPLTIDVLANDSDPDGDTITIQFAGAPQHGTTEKSENVLRYIPAADYTGPDTFTYTVDDGNGGTDTATVSVIVESPAVVLSEGLVLYYPFNGDANDASGNGTNGTVYGVIPTNDRFGMASGAYHFDGDDYIKASADLLPTAERTVALWFYADTVDTRPVMLGYGGQCCGHSWFMGVNLAGAQSYMMSSHWGANTIEYPYSEEPVGTWIHYAMTTDSSGTKIYINGEEKAENSIFVADTVVAGKDLAIGVDVYDDGYAPYVDGNVGYFVGSMDEVRIYNRSLSAVEIRALYSYDSEIIIPPDDIPPETQILSGPGELAQVCQNTVTFGYTGNDIVTQVGDLQFAWRIDEGNWSAFSDAMGQTPDDLANGLHVFEVAARDRAGNVDPSPAVRSFTVDLNPPGLSNVVGLPSLSSATISWNTSEGATSQVEYGLSDSYGMTTPIDDQLATAHSVVVDGLGPAATYHFRVISLDDCGHESVSPDATLTTVNDVAPPETLLTTSPPLYGKACNTRGDICWSGNDDFTPAPELQFSSRIDAGDWSDWSTAGCRTFAELTPGPHTVMVRSRDNKGNVDASPAVSYFYVDLTPPTLSSIAAAPRDYRATVGWNTDEPATSLVEYGETAAYGLSSTLDPTMRGAHSVTLGSLAPQTTYHFRVKSNDGCREVVSEDATFTTTEILFPNLRVVKIDARRTCRSLEKIDFKWAVRNDGPGDAPGSWVDRVYLSTDDVVDALDTLLGEYPFTEVLEWETERWRVANLDMPMMPHGTYYLIVATDGGGAIHETNESDNILAVQIDYLMNKQLTAAPDQIPVRLNPEGTATGEIELINLGVTTLTGLAVSVEGNSPNITLQATPPPTLDGLTVQKVRYTVSAADESVMQNSPVLKFATAEGAETAVTFNITVNPRYPNLVAVPAYLEMTMVRGAQTMAEFEITNTGALPAQGLRIALPATDWLSLTTTNTIPVLGVGEKIKVGLLLKPTESLPLGPYTGTIALMSGNAGAAVGFHFTAISDKIGGLKIVAEDEFTYFADNHPPVAGAAVKVKNPFDGSLIAEGLTDENGQFVKDNLFEGFYNIEISAEKHASFNGNVLVAAGQTKEIKAFLARQLVTYTWKVEPVQTEDRYVVTLETVFETHVPAPVITVEPMVLDLSKVNFDANGTATVNYTVSNQGFIAANGSTIRFGTHPDYQITPLTENIGSIPAMSSMFIPVVVQKLSLGPLPLFSMTDSSNMFGAAASSPTDCGVSGAVDYYYVCVGNQWQRVSITIVTGDCPPSSTPGIGAGGGGWGWGGVWGGGIGGGGVWGGGPGISGTAIQQDLPCSSNCDFSGYIRISPLWKCDAIAYS